MKHLAIAAAAAFALLGTAHAQQFQPFQPSNIYGEVGYTFLKFKSDDVTTNPGAIRGMVGYEFHPYFAVEGMLMGGVSDDSTNVTVLGVPVTAKMKVDSSYGVYLKPKYDINQFEVFGRLGWAHTKVRMEASAGGITASDTSSGSDFSYGVGANWNINPKMRLGLDYMNYYDKDSNKIDGWTISFGYRF
jgi:opacity protein-like surface antigen